MISIPGKAITNNHVPLRDRRNEVHGHGALRQLQAGLALCYALQVAGILGQQQAVVFSCAGRKAGDAEGES